ncbi:alpha-1,2-mannosidase, putative [Cellulosimicrobium aquatile]|uniref:Alpha-1,2-mannosidase, putative n=1 Tax=Cellulosimicrobium aquatile TaxID=1612203 RepID=A0A1N6NTP5_9MICO|nr:GH92 family glycosyl hydrolase [Cellulosimicrobium aquatile]SIP95423.1 alpha-1,2-mannosidase, putative [Cellulosimicrobium aquatile]
MRRPRLALLAAGLALAVAPGTLLPAAAGAAPADEGTVTAAASDDLTLEVNPFVGTESEGNAYPGATVPFGMVQLSPDNTNSYASTSYSTNAGRVWGFSHRHVNSAGCPAAGELLVTPDTSTTPRTSRSFIAIKDQKSTERASAGFYEVTLANDVRAELTATTRVGAHRYTFPASTTSHLSFNVGQTLRDAGASSVTWVDDRTLEGWVDNGGFCGGTPDKQRYFFSATFDRPVASSGTWGTDARYVAGSTTSEVAGGNNGAVAVFDTTTDRDVEVSVGVSFVSVDGARANREAEATDEGGQVAFDTVREEARDAWNAELGRAAIDASPDQRRIFYTQLYKTLLSPTIGSDVDGRYRGMDLEVHQADGWDYYQNFSLWDTYRTQATLHALLLPERAQDIVRSMYQHRVEGGWLPRWSLGALETNIMAGDPVTPWLAENFALGTVPDDIADELWDYLVENATTTPPDDVASVGRRSTEFYAEHGHVPFYPENEGGLGGQFEEYRHGGSATLELALADASLGAAAERTGREGSQAFLDKGRNWRNLWNPDVQLSGGFQGMVNAKRPTGDFVTLPELTDVTRSGFHEGVPWQYQWMVPQDVTGLQEVMGGEGGFVERLDYYFDQPALAANPGVSPSTWAKGGSSYYTTIRYNPGNEPTIMNAWLYGYVGQPWKTNDVLAANLNRFPDTPGGGVGNDDLGTLAAWYVMASLGFEPVMPGSGILALNAPKVQAATLTTDAGATLRIDAAGANEKLPSYVAGLEVDGVAHTAAWLDVAALQDGGTLDFDLSDTSAGLTWGTAAADRIPSVSAVAPPAPVEVEASARCLGGRAFVAVRATSTADAPVDVTLTTPFGERTVRHVQPGRSAYQSFTTRATSVEAGTATVTVVAADGTTTTVDAAYDALACG